MDSFFSFLRGKKPSLKIDFSKGNEAYKKGCSLADKRQCEEALIFLDIAINNAIAEAYQERGHCLMSLEFYIDAIEDFNIAIKHNSTDCNLYFCRGLSRHTIGDLSGAISDKSLAIAYSKLKNEENANRDIKAKNMGYNSITEYYEVFMEDWERDLDFDINMRDKLSKLTDASLANQLLNQHCQMWDVHRKRR